MPILISQIVVKPVIRTMAVLNGLVAGVWMGVCACFFLFSSQPLPLQASASLHLQPSRNIAPAGASSPVSSGVQPGKFAVSIATAELQDR